MCQQLLGQFRDFRDSVRQASHAVLECVADQTTISEVPVTLLVQLVEPDEQAVAGFARQMILVLFAHALEDHAEFLSSKIIELDLRVNP